MITDPTQTELVKPFLISIIEYIIAAEMDISHEQLRDMVETTFPGVGGVLVDSIARHWAEKGNMIGLQQSLAQNRDLFLESLRYGLATRFDIDLHHFDTELHPLNLTTLTTLSERAFTATTLTEFEAALDEITTTSPPDQTA